MGDRTFLSLSKHGGVRAVIESDVAFYVAVGVFVILVFVLGLGAATTSGVIDLSQRELIGFAGGFALFMGSYFFALVAYRIIER